MKRIKMLLIVAVSGIALLGCRTGEQDESKTNQQMVASKLNDVSSEAESPLVQQEEDDISVQTQEEFTQDDQEVQEDESNIPAQEEQGQNKQEQQEVIHEDVVMEMEVALDQPDIEEQSKNEQVLTQVQVQSSQQEQDILGKQEGSTISPKEEVNQEVQSTEDKKEDVVTEVEIKSSNQIQEQLLYEQLTQVNEEGAVAVAITFFNPVEENQDYWVFEILLNTHSVDLEQYDYPQLITLIIDEKKVYQKELGFETEGAGHHVTKYIKLPKVIDHQNTITESTKTITIMMKEIDGIPLRTFEWGMSQFQNYLGLKK